MPAHKVAPPSFLRFSFFLFRSPLPSRAFALHRLPRGKAATSNPPLARSLSITSFKDVYALVNKGVGPSPALAPAPLPKVAPVFNLVRSACSALHFWRSLPSSPSEPHNLPSGEEKRIVLYFTTLRVVRKTFEDCHAVRSIPRGFCVTIDEQDLSMDMGFLAELKGILGR